MFKVGDKVVSKNIISVGEIEVISTYENLTISEILYGETYLKFKEKIYSYQTKYFIDIKEYRKQKLKKLCSK